MKEIENNKTFYFVDESGDPIFFDKYGRNLITRDLASPILILGFIYTKNASVLRKEIIKLQDAVINDKYLCKIPSWNKSIVSFHAKDDCPEVREKVFKLIKDLDFKAQVIVARKIEDIFRKKHNGDPEEFYSDLITKLFKNRLHLNNDITICFAARGNKNKQDYLENAIQTAKNEFDLKWKYKNNNAINIYSNIPSKEPCLQIIDYVEWAIQRAFIKKETRYIEFILDKVSMIWDLYDFENYKRKPGGVIYTKKNQFNLNKISPF